MIIQHNMMAMNTGRQFSIVNHAKTKSAEKLSSGYRINRAADDAAGLSISEKMRNQIRGLNQAMQNVEDGISLVRVADGALEETHNILKRIGELAVHAANDTNNQDDREMMDAEVQQLKTELKSIFKRTEFNGQKIFDGPFVPEITGRPNDLQLFNVDSDTHGGYGGVTINNIRYTWEEMGVAFEEDGVTFVGGTYEFNTWDGERVVLNLKEGSKAPYVERENTWRADETGLYVNEKLAATWQQMNMSNDLQAGTYSFDWSGTTISFEVNGGDTLSDIISEINNRDFNAKVSWRNEYSGTSYEKAVDISDASLEMKITDSWKSSLPTENDYFYIVADEEGVQLKDSQNKSYTKMLWSDFKDVSGTAGSSSNGGYPIVDWGVSNGSNGSSSITLDDSAVYRYKDNKTGLQFDFRLSDEASRIEVISGISQDKITQRIVAPVAATVTQASSDSRFSVSASVGMKYDLQYSTGKSFNAWSTPFNTSYNVNKTSTGYELEYKLDTNQVRTMKASISDAAFRSALKNGGTMSINFSEENGKTDFSFGMTYTVQKFDTSQVRAKAAEKTTEWFSQNVNVGLQQGDDGYIEVGGTEWNRIYNEKYQEKYNEQYEIYFNRYVDDAFNYLKNTGISTAQTAQPYQQIYINESANQSKKTSFDAILNPIEKSLVIQSGANSGEVTTVRWNCLNLATIGMGGANVLDRSNASDAMYQVERAVKMISAERSKFGAAENRLEKCYNNNANYAENLQSAESKLRDTDMAAEMARYSKQKILEQAGQAMLAQANQMNQSVLQLLQV